MDALRRLHASHPDAYRWALIALVVFLAACNNGGDGGGGGGDGGPY